MTETDSEYMANVTVRLSGGKDINEICSMLRGLLYSDRQSDGHTKKNRDFQRGVTITFGAAPMARKFVAAVDRHFSNSVLQRLSVELHG